MPEKKELVPEWFKYDAGGKLDIEATAAAAPEKLDGEIAFFRQVPEWFDTGSVEDLDETLTELENTAPGNRGNLSAAEPAGIDADIRQLQRCTAVYFRTDLTPAQKELARALCYWGAVKIMGEVPPENDGL